ncbi:hypothetical protein AwDysgo_10610 [Bacteroidales bacterium]|nr:hypothetical protein AwDysgo_10610 [Bacteroidales bacterium]
MKTKINMKNYISLLLFASIFFFACAEDEKVKIAENIKVPAIVNLTQMEYFALSLSQAESVLRELSWTPTEYGFDTPIRYTLQVASDKEFTELVSIGETSSTKMELTAGRLNIGAYKSLGIVSKGSLYMRILSHVQASIPSVYSEVFTLVVDTYDPSPSIVNPSSGKSYQLKKENAEKIMDVFSWTAADLGFPNAAEYTVEIDLEGGDFSKPISLVKHKGLSSSIIVEQMNMAVSKLIEAGATANILLRIHADLGSTFGQFYSQEVLLSISTYEAAVSFPVIYLPGAYQDWNPENAPALTSIKDDGIYSAYVYFKNAASAFKITKTAGWDGAVGTDLVSPSGSVEDAGSDNNFKMTGTEGEVAVYYITVNLVANTIHAEPKTDWIADPRVNTWSIIGDAVGGWDASNDALLVFDDKNSLWKANVAFSATGEYKFRANQDWALDYGSPTKDIYDLSGPLKPGGGGENLLLPQVRTYAVSLDFRNLENPNYLLK